MNSLGRFFNVNFAFHNRLDLVVVLGPHCIEAVRLNSPSAVGEFQFSKYLAVHDTNKLTEMTVIRTNYATIYRLIIFIIYFYKNTTQYQINAIILYSFDGMTAF